jgi:opacity protein-like surface antigen
MRKVSTLVGLTLFALAGSARAQETAAPAGDTAAPPAGDAAAAPAPAPEAAPAAPAAASDSKMQAGINLIPVLLGKTKTDGGSADAAFGYGFGLTFSYAVIPGLYVGVAPQLLLGLKPKDNPLGIGASKAIDILARVAYVYTVMPKLGVYAEVLPGYSIILPPEGDKGKGFVIAGGVGAMYDVTDQVYVNLGVGYQYGLQKVDSTKANFSFLRIAVGAGMKF